MGRWRESICSVLLIATAGMAKADTQLTIYNQDERPIWIWYKLGWQRNWAAPTRLDPGLQIVVPLRGQGTLDLAVEYYQDQGQSVVRRVANGVEIESLADISRQNPETLWTIGYNSRVTSRWVRQNGRLVPSGAPQWNQCPWTFYGEAGNVFLALPQDQVTVAKPKPRPFPPRPQQP